MAPLMDGILSVGEEKAFTSSQIITCEKRKLV
jgi:hypothetical protein